jgi:hypothetical protein
MTRFLASLILCLGMVLLSNRPAAAASASSMPSRTSRLAFVTAASPPLLGFLSLEIEIAPIQRDADYIHGTDHRPHRFGIIAFGLGVSLILLWLFGVEPALKFRGDPLPRHIRSRLDQLDLIRLSVLAAVRACRKQKDDSELSEEKRLYEEIRAASDVTFDKIRRDLRLNFVDEENIVPVLDDLIARGQGLSLELRRLAPVPAAEDKFVALPFGAGTLQRINRGWERVFAGSAARLTMIEQISSMRWPPWTSLGGTQHKSLNA